MKLRSLLLGGAAALGLLAPLGAGAQPVTQCVTNAQAGGTGDALTVPLLPCGLATNLMVLTLTSTNATTTPTLQMVGYSPLPIVNANGGAIAIGDLASGSVVLLSGTGSQWRVMAKGIVPSGTGTVTTTGSPASGNLAKFSGATSITNGDLSGDITTSGGLAATLAASGVVAGSYGDSSNYPTFTVDGKGRLTTASQVTIGGSGVNDLVFFGSGVDGDVTISSGRTSITRDMYYHNLTISGTGSLDVQAKRVFVSGTLDISAAPYGAISLYGSAGGTKDASNGSGASGGGSPTGVAKSTVGGSIAGGAGANGGTGAGSQGTAGSTPTQQPLANASGTSGAGGSGSSGSGGGTRAGVTANHNNDLYALTTNLQYQVNGSTVYPGDQEPSGPGGASGGGDGTNSGGGGGGGGQSEGVVFIAARTINRSGSTAVGALNADAGNAGNGASPAAGNTGGGGGGGGAGGGWLYVIYRNLTGTTATNALSAHGGNAGTGGNGHGTGNGGNGGASGGAGRISTFNLAAGTLTQSLESTTTVAGSAASGATGGAGGTAATQAQSL